MRAEPALREGAIEELLRWETPPGPGLHLARILDFDELAALA